MTNLLFPLCHPVPIPSLCYIVATVVFALLGVAAQLLGGSLTRGGSPSAFDHEVPESSYLDVRIPWMLEVFERQLVSDGGSTLSNFGTLLAIVAVVASIPIGFPDWWLVGALATGAFALFPFAGVYHGLQQMQRKRNRMQNLFNALPPTDPNAKIWATGNDGVPIRSQRDYWVDRHPSLGLWGEATGQRRLQLLLRQLWWSSKLYFPIERP